MADVVMPDSLPYRYWLEVDFPSTEIAKMMLTALQVDEELHQDRVTKVLSTQDRVLRASFAAVDARMLRVSVNSFMEMVILATRTLDAF